MLCALCITIFQGPAKAGNHHETLEDLMSAAKSGCRICKYLCRTRDDYGHDEASELQTNPLIRFCCVQYPGEELRIKFISEASWLRENAALYSSITFHTSEPTETPECWAEFLEKARTDLRTEPWRVRADMFPYEHIPTSTGDEKVSDLAIEWLKSCQGDHDYCRQPVGKQNPRYYPKRLLDVGGIDNQTCRLIIVENGKLEDDSGYVALSHCWGREPSFLQLTGDNIDDLQREIRPQHLAKSFLDSIETCRRLGFRYLWIDCLCIIQSGLGSEEDWQLHAATMNLVYSNCELNLAVTWAANADQGAFVERDADFLQPARIYAPIEMGLHDASGTSPSATSFSNRTSSPILSADGNEKCTEKEASVEDDNKSVLVTIYTIYDVQAFLWKLPLQTRGWVVQERVLAPRTLHFSQDRIYWECQEKSYNEYFPWGAPESGYMFDPYYKKAFSLPQILRTYTSDQITEEQTASLYNDWYLLVGDYSRTSLTYSTKDKLVAIAAIAEEFNSVLSSRYVAGMFLSNLPLGLLWQTSDPEGERNRYRDGAKWIGHDGWQECLNLDYQRACSYRAPTWSWASVDCQVNHWIPALGIGGLGHWQESRQVLATVVAANVELVDQRSPYGQISSTDITIEGPVSTLKPLPRGDLQEWIQANKIYKGRYNGTDQLVALHIFEENRIEDHDTFRAHVHCLLLSTSDLVTYRRVGICEFEGPIGSRYPASNFTRATVRIV